MVKAYKGPHRSYLLHDSSKANKRPVYLFSFIYLIGTSIFAVKCIYMSPISSYLPFFKSNECCVHLVYSGCFFRRKKPNKTKFHFHPSTLSKIRRSLICCLFLECGVCVFLLWMACVKSTIPYLKPIHDTCWGLRMLCIQHIFYLSSCFEVTNTNVCVHKSDLFMRWVLALREIIQTATYL